MTILGLSILMLAGLVARRFRRKGLASAAFVLAALLWILVGCGPAAEWLADSFQPSTPPPGNWQARNVIVLLGAGTTRTRSGAIIPSFLANGRIIKTAQLYHDCDASRMWCAVEVSGGDAVHSGRSEASVYAAALVALGVPMAAVLMEDKSMNTWQNAHFSAALLSRAKPDAVWLVSSAMHLPRASLYFAHAGIRVQPVAADYINATVGWVPQAWNFAVADLVLHEYVGVWQYRWYEALGWNPPRSPQIVPSPLLAGKQP